jgi:hypothetical protein
MSKLADYFHVTNGITTIGLFAHTEQEALDDFRELTGSAEAWIVWMPS